MKTEIFEFINASEDLMQEEINMWFGRHPDIKIKFIQQSEAITTEDFHVTISIFYIEDIMKGGQED